MDCELQTNLSNEDLKKLQSIFPKNVMDSHVWRYVCLSKLDTNSIVVCEDGSYVVRLHYRNKYMESTKYFIWSQDDYVVNRGGYYVFSNTLVHRAVASAFIPFIEGKDCVNHIDGNKQNNYYKNLEWCTRKENTLHYRSADCFKEKREEGDKKSRLASIGRPHIVTDEIKQKQSVSMKKMYAQKGNTLWVHNDSSETLIVESELDKYIDNNYSIGRLNIVNTYIHKGNTTKKISENEVDSYLKDGWSIGKSDVIQQNIKASRQKYVWCYDNKEFVSAKELSLYLNNNGYPNIVPSTITALYNKGFDKSEVYNSLNGKITRYENTKN